LIVRTNPDHLLLITQPDHAALSAAIMAPWRRDGLPDHPRREWLLLATREHDAGWAEVDVAPIVDPASGRLLDFVHAPDAVRQEVWPRSIERLAHTPYAAALVAQHALHVYRDNRSNPAWAAFFSRLEDLRSEQLRRAAPLTLDELVADYFFVRMGDLVSLFFANNWSGPRREGDYSIRVQGPRVTVSPDPFDGEAVSLSLPARRLPARAYNSVADAAAALASAPMITLDAVAAGS
jgi:transposase InsO family protein